MQYDCSCSFIFIIRLSLLSLSAHVDQEEEEKRARRTNELSLNRQKVLPVCLMLMQIFTRETDIIHTRNNSFTITCWKMHFIKSSSENVHTHIYICIYFVAHRRFISMVVSLTSSSTYSFRHTHGHALSCACFRLPTFNSLWWSRNSRSSYIYLCNE